MAQERALTFGGDVDGGSDVGQEVGHKAVVQSIVIGPDLIDDQQTFVAGRHATQRHLEANAAHSLTHNLQETGDKQLLLVPMMLIIIVITKIIKYLYSAKYCPERRF